MPLLHQPECLTVTCLQVIARNFEYIVYGLRDKRHMARILEDDSYLEVEGPFKHMPSGILEKAMVVIQEESSIRHVQTRHLHVLMQPQLESFVLTFGSGDVYKALELLQLRCTRLRRLNISYLSTINPPVLLKLPPNLTQLISLDLSSTETSDMVLAAIGQHCTVLRELNVSNCPVSNKALTTLFWDSRSHAKMCRLLTVVNLTGCQVTPATIRQGLQLQPTLRVADFENNLLAFDPMYSGIWEGEEDFTFSITSLTATSMTISSVTMETATAACPFVTSFSLHACIASSDALLNVMGWQNLTQLRLTNTDEETIQFTESVLPILTVVGHQLTALLLSRFTYVNVSVLGVACPVLENLALSNIALYEPIIIPPKDLFKNLQALEVWSDLANSSLSTSILKTLLRSALHIRNLLLSGCAHFGDDFLMGLWTENAMPQLERLTVDSCPQFSYVSLYELFSMTNALNFVRIWSCPRVAQVHEARILATIKTGNMDVFFEWFPWMG